MNGTALSAGGGPVRQMIAMQEHTTKGAERLRGRSAPVRILDPRAGGNEAALHQAHLEYARAEQALFNLTGHVPRVPGGIPSLAAPFPYGPYALPYPSAPWGSPAFAALSGASLPGLAAVPGLAVPGSLPRLVPETGARLPACDIADEGTGFVVQAELPGVQANQVSVLAFDRTLLVQATPDAEVDVAALVQRERSAGILLQRSILLPAEIQPSACTAQLRDGILTVSLPKLVPTEAPRRIDVKA